MSCDCGKKVKNPKYKLFGKPFVKMERGMEVLPRSLDQAVVDSLNQCNEYVFVKIRPLVESPDGTMFEIKVANDGTLSATPLDSDCNEI